MIDALGRLDPARRSLLDLSLRRGMDASEIADALGAEVDSIVSLREGALEEVATEIGLAGAARLDAARDLLAELPADEWRLVSGQPAAENGVHAAAEPRPAEAAEAAEAQAEAEQVAGAEENGGQATPPFGEPAAAGPEHGEPTIQEGPAADEARAEETPAVEEAGAEPATPEAAAAEQAGAEEPGAEPAVEEPAAAAETGLEQAEAEPATPEAAAAEEAGAEPATPAATEYAEPAMEESTAAAETGLEQLEAEPATPEAAAAEEAGAEPATPATTEYAEPAMEESTAAEPGAERGSAEARTIGAAATASAAVPGRKARRRGRIALLVVAAAAVAGIVLAVTLGGKTTHHAQRQAPTAQAPSPPATVSGPSSPPRALTSLPGGAQGVSGTIRLLSGGRAVAVSVRGLPKPNGVYGVWLFNSVIDSVPIGHFASTSAQLTLPIPSGAAHKFRAVDISLQPNGSLDVPSGISVLRAPLAGAR